ncbi:hypothetical protein GQ600_8970 [Phytophthora cactorum]|nr:hypothetical protein GQ600_8970 [Phytophthora cactorum]
MMVACGHGKKDFSYMLQYLKNGNVVRFVSPDSPSSVAITLYDNQSLQCIRDVVQFLDFLIWFRPSDRIRSFFIPERG